jgi:serine/threonine protein phosphatase PrpC
MISLLLWARLLFLGIVPRAVSSSLRTVTALKAAGGSDPGQHREVNEDRFHVDVPRGLFLVVDGVGGQAAGGKAADIALTMLRTRLERETGPVIDRVREAIAIANNEIHRVARLRPEWNGMACVLTVAVVDETRAVVGHVGDTRLYKLRGDRIAKITSDHSPVGEREDSQEISELEAMRHPRRNEVYRDVGSEPHQPDDPEFIEIHDIPFESDAALLLCSDGLTDLLESSSLQQIVAQLAGQPQRIVKALIDAANAAGGKDNISVIYVEGELFPQTVRAPAEAREQNGGARGARWQRGIRIALVLLLTLVIGMMIARVWPYWPLSGPRAPAPSVSSAAQIVVPANESISLALLDAAPGSEVIVEPGEYHETLTLKSGVRVVSRVPRGATIRLAGTASEADAAVVASEVTGAELVGFRIVGDAATPLGTGVLIKNAEVSIVDVEVTGAADVAIDIGHMSHASLLASEVHDNPGAALAIRTAMSTRIAHNIFARNGKSERVPGSFIIDDNAEPRFSGNIFHGIGEDAFARLHEAMRTTLRRDNFFVEPPNLRSTPVVPRGRRGR